MAIDESGSQTLDRGRAQQVSLSKWVNERIPSFQELLTAHDVARLTRRHRWVLTALTLFGRFPRRQRFHGRRIGWLRSDVLELARGRCRSRELPRHRQITSGPNRESPDVPSAGMQRQM